MPPTDYFSCRQSAGQSFYLRSTVQGIQKPPRRSQKKMFLTISPADKQRYDQVAVQNFQEYLRIPSVQPDIDYDECVRFVEKLSKDIGLPCKVIYPKPKRPVIVVTLEGTDPTLPSILLNGHMDVVPVFADKWTQKPFGAEIVDGKIYGRGTQDMKSISIQYMETIRRIKDSGKKLKRTLHCSFVPDEEIGGVLGMAEFIKTEDFKKLNIGFALDEGIANPTETFTVYKGEKCMWHLKFHCPGQPGHGCLLHENTAAEKVRVILNKIYDHRDVQKKVLKENPDLTLADVITLNATIIEGGVQANVLSDEHTITVDVRMPYTVDSEGFWSTLQSWCKEAGEGVWIEKLIFDPITQPTSLDSSNIYWTALEKTLQKLNLQVSPLICPGVTDSRYLRRLGIPALGLSLINNTPILIHDHDEYLRQDTFLRAIEIYTDLIPAVANV